MMRTPLGAIMMAAATLATQGSAQETKTTPTPPPVRPSAAKPDSKPTLTGYLQFDLRYGDPRGAAKLPDHELNVRRARVSLSGKVTERVSYTATVQGDGVNASSASLLDVSADLTLSRWAVIRAGQYKYDFDLEGRESDAFTPLIDRSYATNTVAGGLNGASTAANAASGFRDRGLSLIGKGQRGSIKLGYALGVFQGAGRANDNNDDFALTLNGNVEPLGGLKLNAGLLRSRAEDKGGAPKNVYSALALGAAFERGRIFARTEYYRGRRDLALGRQDLAGFYVTGSYTLLSKLDLMGRYEQVADERYGPSGNEARGVGFSAVLYLDRRTRRSGTHLSLTYFWREADEAFKSGLTLFNDGRGAAIESGSLIGNVLVARMQVAF
jgi:hypothetical protein